MKTKNFLLAASLLTAMLAAPYCSGQSNVVFYGTATNAIAITFVDTNLSAAAKASIVSDLQLCLQNWGNRTEFRFGADDPAFVAHLYNPKINPHYPETVDFPDNVVSNGTMGFALQIPKKLSDAYTNAFAFASANSNIVAAAYEFVAFVSSTNFVSISPNALPNYLVQKGVTTNEIIAAAQETISELQHQTYYPPSILGFEFINVGPLPTNLWLRVPCSSLSGGGGVEWSPFPAIWHDGKWKFCIWN